MTSGGNLERQCSKSEVVYIALKTMGTLHHDARLLCGATSLGADSPLFPRKNSSSNSRSNSGLLAPDKVRFFRPQGKIPLSQNNPQNFAKFTLAPGEHKIQGQATSVILTVVKKSEFAF